MKQHKWASSLILGAILALIFVGGFLLSTFLLDTWPFNDNNVSTPAMADVDATPTEAALPTATAEPTPTPTQAMDTLSKAEVQTIAEDVMDTKFDDGEFNFASKEDIDTAVSEIKAKLDELGHSPLDEDALRLIVTEIVNEKLTELLIASSNNDSSTDNGNSQAQTSNVDQPPWLGSQCVLASSIPGVSDKVMTSFTASGALAYPDMIAADPNRSSVDFPDDIVNGVKPLVGYDKSFESGDYFEDCFGDTDVPQFYWRVETTGYFWIPKSDQTPEDIVCLASEEKGCALIYINHFGPTMKINSVYDDNGFTVAGDVWNMEKPEDVTAAAQVLIDHFVYRMVFGEDDRDGRNAGTNCGTIEGCNSVEWHVVVYGNGELQKHWTGLYKSN